ncbi:MBG domain-containing protein [Niveispirillum sp. KHB5.9]|uniref:MBG domain-containing protein n=1 Tax=Niveispirillum sp. KHB5.9 TaxID=3400269 RepID=UPI003A85E9F5
MAAAVRWQAGRDRRWRRGFRALTLASVFTLPAAAQSPQGGTVVVGGATIAAGQGGQTLINQTSDRALIDWRSFDIGKDASVLVTQPGAGSLLVNRVTGNGAGTRIDGSLSANGQVVIIDKAGIVIGRAARVDAGAFLATTADIDNADFAAGRLVFGKAGLAGASVVNEGTIRVADGGYAVLAAPEVRNGGLVEARLGRVVLAGTERFTLDLAGDGLLRFELPADVAGRVVNDGTLTGTRVLMTARAARDGMAGVVNAGGLVEATAAREVDGRIIIGGEGTETAVTGTVRAEGGAIDILGDKVALAGATVDATGAVDGGSIRIGGDFQGGGDLHRAQTTSIDAGSRISADGATGAGGRVIVWADGRTDHAGAISARGATDGGFAEVSGKGTLRFAGTADLAGGKGGKAGQLLLDPTNITIGTVADVDGAGSQDDDIPSNGTIGSGDYSGADSLITASAIVNLLNSGTSVTLAAGNDINVNSSIAKTAGTGATLSLNAGRDLSFASGVGVTSTSGALSMDFDAGRSFQATGGSFTSNGGNISVTATGTGATTGINLSGASFSSGSGSLTLAGAGSATGVHLGGNSSLSVGNGGMGVTGTGAVGVDFAYGTATSTGVGDIAITGTSNGTGAGAVGIRLDRSSGGAISASAGDISLTGTGGGGTGTANYGVLASGGFAVSAGSGDVAVTATGGTGSVGLAVGGSATFGGSGQSGTVTLRADGMVLDGATIRSSGRVHLRADSASRALIVGGTDDSAGLALSTTELSGVTAGVLTLGDSTGGTVTVSANPSTTNIGALELVSATMNVGSAIVGLVESFLNAGKNATLETGGAMTVTDGIAKSAGGDASLTLRAAGDLTFNSGIGVTAGTGKLGMAFTGGYNGSGTFGATGAGSFTSNGGDITLAGQSGLTLSSTTVTAGAGTIILAGGDIALTGTSITSTGRVQLRPYATGGQMDIGATGAGSGVANVSQAELNQISAGMLRLGALDGGNLVISSALSHAGDVVELASAGAVTQTADINVASLSLLGTGGSYTLTRTGNDVTTLAANTGSVDFRSNLNLTVGTVAGTTGLTFTGNASLYAGDALITLAQAANYAGSGTGTLTLSSDIDVAVQSTATVGCLTTNPSTCTGKLNIVLAADGNEAGTPGSVLVSGATLSTNGGNITIGSGTNPATRAAEGRAATGIGVDITNSTLNAGSGGTILVNGDGAPGGTNSTTGIGISISGSSTLSVAGNGSITLNGTGGANNDTGIGINISGGNLTATGAGTITLNGTGGAGNTLTAGVAIGAHSIMSTATGALSINGTQAATGTNKYGILLRGDPGSDDATRSAIYSTGGGSVSLTAIGAGARLVANRDSGAEFSRAFIGWNGTTAGGGTVTLTADDVGLSNGSGGSSLSIGGSGNLVVQPHTIAASIGVGDGASGDMALGQVELDTFRAGFSSVTIGRSDGTGAISVSGAAFRDNTNIISNNGAITIAGALSTGSGGDAGTLAVATKGLLTISAAISTQNQDITLSADRLNLTGSLNAGTATATLTTSTAARAIDLGSATDAASALEISSAELNRVTAGTIRIGSSSAGAIGISQAIAPTGSGTLHLRSGAGVTQSGAITVANLAVTATGAVALASANNAVTSFAAGTTNSNVAFRDDTGFAIASVDSVAGVSAGTGNLALTSTGTVTQTTAITAAGLALTGTGGAYTLAHASNAVATVAANTGSIDVGLSGAGSVGTVGSVTGITTSGTTKLTSGGNLTIASGAVVSASGTGDALVLAANGNFTNNGGSGALVVTGGGRFLVFSHAPSTSSVGGISALPLYNRAFTFSGRTYATVSNTGNRFVYSYAPTLTVTPDSVSRTYTGSTITGLTYTVSGLVTGDTLSDAVSGTGTITGAGRNVDAYTLTAGAGTLASDLGYGFSYGTGTLTVTKKALTYEVANGSSTYGTLAGNGAVTWTGLVGGDDVDGTVTTYRGATAETLAVRTNVGSLTQKVTALTGTDAGNYEIAATGNTDGTLTIAQKALTYSVAAVDSIYGTLATLAGAVLTGVVSGDDVTATVGLSGGTLAPKLAAGSYSQTVTLGGADLGNYSYASGHSVGQLTVARKQITYDISDVNATYGTLAVLGTPVLTGVETGDTVTADVLLGSGTLTNRLSAGTHGLVLSSLAGTSSSNYVLAGTGNRNGTLTVAQKALTASIAAVSGTYGQAIAAGAVSLTGLVTGDSVTGDLVVEAGGSSVNVGPTLAAGSYTQRVTGLSGADASNYVLQGGPFTSTLTVTPALLTVTAANLAKIYGTDDPSLTYSVTGLVNGDTLSGGLTRAAGRNVGTYAISQGSLSASSNYTLSFQGGTLTINPAALTITAASVSKVYGTDDPALTYGVTGLVAGDSLSGSLARAAGRDAGTYAISQGSLAAGPNYTVSFVGGTLTVTPAPLTISAASVTKIYGTDDPALTYGVTGLVAGDSLSGTLTRASGRDAGTYAISQGSLSAGPNYNVTFQGGTLTITPAPLTITAASATKVYGTDDPALTYSVSGLLAGDSLSGALERAGGRDVGTYAITRGSLDAGANYTVGFQGGTLTITPAALTITAASVTKVYGDDDPDLAFSVSGLAAGDSLGGALARAGGENVGTYAITRGSLDAGANYVVSFQGGALTVTPAALTVTADAITSLYMDRDPALTYQVSGLKRGDEAGSVLSGALVRAAGSDVGTYAIGQGGLTANANYRLNFTGAEFTILPVNLTLSVVAANLTKIYGDGDPTLTFTATGLRGKDTLEGVLSGSLSRVAGEDVGSYAITQGTLAATSANYVIAFTPGTLTITPANLSVAAMMVTRTYGDGDPTLTYSVSGLKRGDSAGSILSGGLVRAAGEDAGTYAINQGSLALASGNYTMSFTGGQLTINPALLSVTANAVARLYGAADPALTYAVTGLKRGDAAGTVLSGALARDGGGNVGRYAIGQGTLAANGNYRISFQGAELTINPAPLSVLVDSVTRAYGAANPVFTARFQGLVNGDTGDNLTGLRFQTLADATSAAGPYAINAEGITNANYQITYVGGQLTVTGSGVLPPAVAEAAPVTTITQPARAPSVPSVTVAAPVAAAPVAPPPAPAGSTPAPTVDGASAALAAVNQNVQSASGSAADDDSAAEEMIPGLLSQQRRLPGEAPEGTPGLEQQFPNLGRVW